MSPSDDRHPSKIIAVHVSYRSRAMERGALPPWPWYFLKPPNTLAASGDPVARAPGCELLAFEGEIALVIGRRATRVSARDAWDYAGWVTAANDFGVYDLRYADKGSNARSKGIDGYTPLGPELLDARAVDPEAVRLRTSAAGSTRRSRPSSRSATARSWSSRRAAAEGGRRLDDQPHLR
jgi:2-keto-4-pentenoate hydratase/2-oxohepta-3-ene-1,7-dioic acid hydratase in catechol pathway